MSQPLKRPRAQKLGPGELTIGETGTTIDISCQMSKVKITWDIDEADSVPVLCGGMIPGDDTYTATLEGTAYQDLSTGGISEFSWKNKGTVLPFRFVPVTGANIVGEVKVMPLDIGGEVGVKNTADLSWQCIGEPTFTAMTGDED